MASFSTFGRGVTKGGDIPLLRTYARAGGWGSCQASQPGRAQGRRPNKMAEAVREAIKKLSSRSDFVVVVRISYDPVTSMILEQDLREF